MAERGRRHRGKNGDRGMYIHMFGASNGGADKGERRTARTNNTSSLLEGIRQGRIILGNVENIHIYLVLLFINLISTKHAILPALYLKHGILPALYLKQYVEAVSCLYYSGTI